MTRGAASIAIISTRVRKERHILMLAMTACALLGYLQRYDSRAEQLAGSLVFGTLTGIAVALLQRRASRFREIELCELAAPLYGRELARATALVPCIVVSLSVAAYWIVATVYAPPEPGTLALCFFGVNAATLVALCAALRTGNTRALLVLSACLCGAAAFALRESPIGIAIGVFAVIGFLALRQYGEALAHYDPVEI